jgi:integrase/recombinase XerD
LPTKLTTTINKIALLQNPTNSVLLNEFHQYMKSNGASERHQNNNLKAVIAFANFLGTDTTFLDVQLKEQIMSFLDTKIKNVEEDPDKKWITTWNDYLHRIKHFFRWLNNHKDVQAKELVKPETLTQQDWETPIFARIREKKSKRITPYLETELWERDELLSIIKYEPYKRNKAALALF